MPKRDGVYMGAVFSPGRQYRYSLCRIWDDAGPEILFVMLNPSIADERRDDPTQRRCRRFAKEWGYGGYWVGNLFALVSTDPEALRTAMDPVGPENDLYLLSLARRCRTVVLAWGDQGLYLKRDRIVEALLKSIRHDPLMCLGRTKRGAPRHPLYLRADAKLAEYRSGGKGA